jgi:transketolase
MTSEITHQQRAGAIAALSMDAVEKAKSGHPGMPMGMADVATVLWGEVLHHHPEIPLWPDRDRFVLSAGHGSMLLYSLLYLTGYPDMTLEELKKFRQMGARTAGHPEYGHAAGIETTTGPLGQGLANAVGMALAERMMAARFGEELVDHYTYVVAGDGDLMEGISHEAASLAGHLKLGKLIVLFDDNGISIDGSTRLAVSDQTVMRFSALGWDVAEVDGHNPEAVLNALMNARSTAQPSLIACRTLIGKGAPKKGGTAGCHGAPLGAEEIAAAREAWGWPHAPFEIPQPILTAWRSTAERGKSRYAAWCARLDAAPPEVRTAFEAATRRDLGAAWVEALNAFKEHCGKNPRKEATRQSSGAVLEALVPALPALIGGSADLTGSNNTHTPFHRPISAEDYSGNYLHYGVREHAMGAIMNGLALHGAFVPYGGTFLVFSDYMRPAIRLAALMRQRVIYVMTHDSIGLGEDGPTHQPIEHLASLRAIPNLHVFRPADAVETAECWALALAASSTPSLLALSRQAVPQARTEGGEENRSARGGYVLREAKKAKATLIATGTELALALEAAAMLTHRNIPVRVVSMPCCELFDAQPESYRQQVLGTLPRVVIEAGISQCWDRYLRPEDHFIGLSGFGLSAPAPEVYAHFGLTAEAITRKTDALFS